MLLSCSLWLPLALSGSLLLSEFAYNILARLTRPLLSSQRRCNTFCFSGCNHHFEFRHNEREFQQLARTKEISNGDPVLQLCMYFGLCIHPWRSAACTLCILHNLLFPICLQGSQWGFQYYRPHPHKTANYRPIFIFSTVPVSPVKFFANTIETDNLEDFLCKLYRDRF